jgi:hypothetical protein
VWLGGGIVMAADLEEAAAELKKVGLDLTKY